MTPRSWIQWLMSCMCWAMSCTSWGQIPTLPVTESFRAAQEVARGLQVSDSLGQRLLQAALPWDECLAHWNAVQDSLEAAPISESELLSALAPVREELGRCRDLRSKAMRDAVPEEMKQAFDQLVAPGRPSVLHFGIHNRLECVVCKPQAPEIP